MPLIPSHYTPTGIFKNGDVSTIYAGKLRKVNHAPYQRERLHISDGDFIDLDWSTSSNGQSKNLVIILHGLAGSTDRPYMRGMAKAFNNENWDAVGMNFRGCSEEINKYYRSYHAGASDDLSEVITHLLNYKQYAKIALVGFSLGGNLLMKYLGENRERPDKLLAAVGISVPCDLAGSLGAINRTRNILYSKRFEINLKQQLLARAIKFPTELNKTAVTACKNLRDIDELYTSRAHGFKNADEYYEKNSSLNFLSGIEIPVLMINALNDSFLSPGCYPFDIAKNSNLLHLETPKFGGHVGFVTGKDLYYHENRAVNFIQSLV